MKIKQGFILREVAGNFIVVPVGKAAIDFNGIITLNQTGAFLWEKMNKEVTVEELVKHLLDEYNVEKEVAINDITNFIKTLQEANLVE